MKGLSAARQEQGYALISVLLLLVIIMVIGMLAMETVTNSQGMVNVSEDIITAQADGDTKLQLKLSQLRAAIMALKDAERVTLDTVREVAAPYVESGSVILDEENHKYVAVVAAEGISDEIKQMYRRKVEVTLSYNPGNFPPGSEMGDYALVSQGSMNLNGALINGSVYSSGSLTNNNSTISGTVVGPGQPFPPDTPLPGRVEVAAIVSRMDQEIRSSKAALFAAEPTPLGFEIRNNQQFADSVALNSLKLMSGVTLSVDGDLLINGEVTLEANSSIEVSGVLYINGNLLINGGNQTKLQASLVRVNGRTNMNSQPNLTITGDLYTHELEANGTLLANRIYANGSVNSSLNGSNQFALFAAGSVNLNNGSTASILTGSIYANGSLTVNGNQKVTINGGAGGSPGNPDKPSDIRFEEKGIAIM